MSKSNAQLVLAYALGIVASEAAKGGPFSQFVMEEWDDLISDKEKTPEEEEG